MLDDEKQALDWAFSLT